MTKTASERAIEVDRAAWDLVEAVDDLLQAHEGGEGKAWELLQECVRLRREALDAAIILLIADHGS